MSELNTVQEMELKYMFKDIQKIDVEMKKIKQEYFWYPAVVGVGFVLVGIAFTQLFLTK